MLFEKLQSDMIEAMKAKEELRRDTLRMMISDIKKKRIDSMKKEMTDSEVLDILRKNVKTRQDSVIAFTQGNRPELAEKEQKEIKIIEAYLPKQMSDEDTKKIVEDIIQAVGAKEKKDTGRIMKEIMAKHGSVIDGKKVQQFVSEKLV